MSRDGHIAWAANRALRCLLLPHDAGGRKNVTAPANWSRASGPDVRCDFPVGWQKHSHVRGPEQSDRGAFSCTRRLFRFIGRGRYVGYIAASQPNPVLPTPSRRPASSTICRMRAITSAWNEASCHSANPACSLMRHAASRVTAPRARFVRL